MKTQSPKATHNKGLKTYSRIYLFISILLSLFIVAGINTYLQLSNIVGLSTLFILLFLLTNSILSNFKKIISLK